MKNHADFNEHEAACLRPDLACVLDCASPLALWHGRMGGTLAKSARGLAQSKTCRRFLWAVGEGCDLKL